jgi:hypothetical protein
MARLLRIVFRVPVRLGYPSGGVLLHVGEGAARCVDVWKHASVG